MLGSTVLYTDFPSVRWPCLRFHKKKKKVQTSKAAIVLFPVPRRVSAVRGRILLKTDRASRLPFVVIFIFLSGGSRRNTIVRIQGDFSSSFFFYYRVPTAVVLYVKITRKFNCGLFFVRIVEPFNNDHYDPSL